MMAAPACRIDALAIGGVQSGCFFYSPANSRFMTDQQQPTRDDNQQDGSWESMISPPPLTATTASYEPVAVPSAGFLTAPPQSAAPTAPPQSAAFAPIQQQQSPIIDPFRMQYPSRINNNNRMPPIPSLMNCGIYQTPTAAPSHQPYVAAGHWQPGTSLGASATSSPVHQHHLHSSAASNPVIQMAAAAAAAAAAQMLAPGQQQQMPGVMQPQQQQPTHTAQNQTTQHNVGGMMASMGPAPPQQHMYNPANALGAHTQLDPNVIALMQNPTLAYKLLSTFFAAPNQMQQQQQQHHQQPPPPASTIYAAGPLITGPAEAFIRQQLQQQQYRQQQMQQQHQQHQHQQQQQSTNSLAPNLKSLSLDDSSTSNSNDSQRITGGASDMTSSTAVVVTGGGDSGGSGGGCGQANDSDSTGNERVTYRPFHAPVPGNTRRQQHTFYRNTRISNNTNNNCGATNWPPAYTRQYSNNNKYKRDNDDRAYTNNNNNNNNNNQHEYRPTRRSNYSFPRRSAPHPREHSQDVSQRIGRWDAIRDLAYSYRRDGGNASNRGSSRYFDRPVNDFRPRNHDGDRRNIDSDGMTPRNPALELTLFANPSAAINFDQYEKIPVEVKGIDDLEPISSFCDVGFHPILRNSVSLAGYDKPTPVQKYTIPSILRSRDIMSCAQTGSGKTAAFLLPIINHMLNQSMLCRLPSNDQARAEDEARFLQSPRCLILAPTRELCVQIFNEARKFAYRSLLRIVVVYGGTTLRPQLKEIYKGVDIVVATPGRLIDVVERSCLRLDEIRWLVLDEADRMLDMGFEPQIRRIVDDLNMPDKMNRQTAMFSATFPKPIRELAKQFLKDYVFLTVGRIGSTNENIEQRILWVEELDKLDVLIDILGSSRGDEAQQPLTLVFVETKRGADELEQRLRKSGLNVGCIHGDRNQLDREYALNQFRNGHISVLVATAVAARGLDVSNVFHVVNYDLPTDIDDYIHRIGRTGRGGNEGVATSFFNDKNTNLAGDLLSVLTESKQEVPDFLIRMQDQGRFRRFDNRRGYRGARSANYRHHTRNSSGMPFRHYNNTRGLSGGQQCSGFGRRFSAATTTTTAGEMAAADNRGKT